MITVQGQQLNPVYRTTGQHRIQEKKRQTDRGRCILGKGVSFDTKIPVFPHKIRFQTQYHIFRKKRLEDSS